MKNKGIARNWTFKVFPSEREAWERPFFPTAAHCHHQIPIAYDYENRWCTNLHLRCNTAYVSQPHYMNITPGGPESIFIPEAGDTNASTGRLWSLMCHIHSKFKYIAEQPLNILILLKPPGHTGTEKDLQPWQGFLNNKAVVVFSVFSNFVSVFLSIH